MFLFFFVFLFRLNHAQEITLGEKVPDIFIPKILNHETDQARLSDFENKPIILDFWNTWCSACIAKFPVIDSLQKDYDDKMNFLLVTTNNEAEVSNLFNRREILKEIKLPSIVEDTSLVKVFPHRAVPHYVWINKSGTVVAITGPEEVNKLNVDRFTKGLDLNLKLKWEVRDVETYNALLPLATNFSDFNDLEYYAYVGSFREGISSGTLFPSFSQNESINRIVVRNNSLIDIYRQAYQKKSLHPKQIIYNEDTERFFKVDFLKNKNVFCFEQIIPSTSKEYFYKRMIQFLDDHFNLISGWEKREVNTWVIKKVNLEKIEPKATVTEIYRKDGYVFFKNVKYSVFLNYMSNIYPEILKLPIIDEADYDGFLDIEMPLIYENEAEIVNTLELIGIEIVNESRIMDVLVFNRM